MLLSFHSQTASPLPKLSSLACPTSTVLSHYRSMILPYAPLPLLPLPSGFPRSAALTSSLLLPIAHQQYAPPVSLRAATVPGWENKVTVPLDNVFPKGSRHLVLSGVKAIHLGAKSVKLEKDVEGFGREIQFEFAVIATVSLTVLLW